MLAKIFLHGGGDRAESRAATFGHFAAEAVRQPADKVALVIAEVEETAVLGGCQSTRQEQSREILLVEACVRKKLGGLLGLGRPNRKHPAWLNHRG